MKRYYLLPIGYLEKDSITLDVFLLSGIEVLNKTIDVYTTESEDCMYTLSFRTQFQTNLWAKKLLNAMNRYHNERTAVQKYAIKYGLLLTETKGEVDYEE